MARVEKSDLFNVNSKISFMTELAEENKNIVNRIKEFNNNSIKVLEGSAYNALRNRLLLYVDAFEKQSTIFENLQNNLTAVNNSMINYMEEFNSLDDSYIEQTKTAIENAEKKLKYLENALNNSRLSSSTRQQVISAINTLKQEIARLKRLLEKLTGLKPKDNELDGKLSNTKNDIENFASAVNKITITKYVS